MSIGVGAGFQWSPEGWVEYFRETAERVDPPSAAAGGRCWVPVDAVGVQVNTAAQSRRYILVRWPDETVDKSIPAYIVTLAAAANGGVRKRSPVDGAIMPVHHLCRNPECVRPDHLEFLSGHHNVAEVSARRSASREASERMAEAEAEIADLQHRLEGLLRELGRVRDERDTAVGLLEKLGNRVLELDAELGRARDESARLYERLEKRR